MSTTVNVATASSTPLTVVLQESIPGTSDFFPFDDIASLNKNRDSEFNFKAIFEAGLDGSPSVTLYTSGCQVSGIPDCSVACANSDTLFGSLETFYNCATLASIDYYLHDVKSLRVTDATESNASFIMGSSSLAEFDGTPVLDNFVTCAKDSCDNDDLTSACNRSIETLSTNTSTPEEIFDAMDTFCPDLTAQINPDIFGPGVLISYVLQVCFSASLYLLLKGFTLWVRITQGSKPKPKPFALKRTLTRVESIIWRDSGAMSRTSIAIATTLVEFQEAQCWFIFAAQLAAILAIAVNSQEGTFWGEIVVNAAIAYHVSQNGVLPMFLIQICLHHEGIRNWHTFLGFFFEYVLAIVATTQTIQFNSAFDLFKKQNPMKGCGYNPSPRTYCAAMKKIAASELSFFPHPLLYKMTFLILDTIAIIMLILDQLAWTLRRHHRTKDIQIGRYRFGRWPDGRMKRHGLRIKRGIWRILEVSYLIINILYMVSLIQVINAGSFAANRWSYGQIIAVTVWGPIIVKLFDMILSGPPKNGRRLNSGPPRLRIDNVINGRTGTSADDELEEDEKSDLEMEVTRERETREGNGPFVTTEGRAPAASDGDEK